MARKKQRTKGAQTGNTFPGLMVSDRVELKDVQLISCKCHQTPKAATGKKTYNINYSAKVETDKKKGHVVVLPEFYFEAFSEAETREPVILIDASFVLAYKINDFKGLTKRGFEQFANLNGIYNAWPYWRELVQNIIVRMGLPSLSIPVFRIAEAPKQKGVKQKEAKTKVKKKKMRKG
jgi:preprotein translocase subunit SecB